MDKIYRMKEWMNSKRSCPYLNRRSTQIFAEEIVDHLFTLSSCHKLAPTESGFVTRGYKHGNPSCCRGLKTRTPITCISHRIFFASRSEWLTDKAGAVEDVGLGEYTLLKNETSPKQSGRCAASRSRNSVRYVGQFRNVLLWMRSSIRS